MRPRYKERTQAIPFEIVRNEIINICVDAIFNTENPRLVFDSGMDAVINAKAGPLMLAVRKVIGTMNTGDAGVRPGFKLLCKYVIHTAVRLELSDGFVDQVCRVLDNCYVYKREALDFPAVKFRKLETFPCAIEFETFLPELALRVEAV